MAPRLKAKIRGRLARKWYGEGRSIPEIAAKLGIKDSTVRYRLGGAVGDRIKARHARVRALYETGEPRSVVAGRTGMSPAMVDYVTRGSEKHWHRPPETAEARIRRIGRVATRKAEIRRKLSRVYRRRGLTLEAISAKLGITRERVRQCCVEIGLSAADVPRAIPGYALAKAARNLRWHERMIRAGQMAAMYRNGAKLSNVAAKYGVSASGVRDILERRGIDRRPRGTRGLKAVDIPADSG